MNERDLFLSALEIDDPAARRAHLQAACADNGELLTRVESLLASHEGESRFLQTPVGEQLGDPTGQAAATLVMGTGSTHDESPSGEAPSILDFSQLQERTRMSDEIPLGYLGPSTKPGSLGRLAHYEILEVIGQGAFGTVLRAFDEKLQRVVAIKVMAPELAATSPARKRFIREAQASAQIRHENVVSVYSVEEKPIPYLVMEYIPGVTLQQRLDERGPLEVLTVLRLGRQIAEGLAAAHAKDLIHRDIKPGNILLETGVQDRVKITDFGLARAADDASMSQSGVIAGTPMYMAPEQALGHKLDQRADLFSFGSVLYQMVSGRPPFRASSTLAVLKRLTEDTPRPIREIIPETPAWLCDIITKLHAKNPDERYQSAREISDVLANCEAQLKEHSRLKDLSLIPRAKTQPAGWWKWVAVAALVLPLLAIGLYAVTRPGSEPKVAENGNSGSSSQEPTPVSVPKQETPPPAIAPFDSTQARAHQDAWAKHLGVRVEYTNSIGMKFTLIPPGEFMMGAPKNDPAAIANEQPQHTVRLTKAYYLGMHEVTVRQFKTFVEETKYQTEAEASSKGAHYFATGGKWLQEAEVTWRNPKQFSQSDDHPVGAVTWHDAIKFCEWLSTKDGKTYLLPTEAEWELACRAGTVTSYHFGWDFEPTKVSGGRQRNGPVAVGQYTANAFGLHDMHGNVNEWCFDSMRAYNGSLAVDPIGPNTIELRRVKRGGSHGTLAAGSRSSSRLSEPPSLAFVSTGFRVAVVGDLKPPSVKQEPPTFKNTIGMEFVIVPKGKSWLGGGKDKLGDKEVEIPADFYLGKYEVTQEEWENVMGENPSHFSRTGIGSDAVKDIPDADLKRFPVENVSWDQCQVFVAKLNQREKETGWVYRLPTEIEWEYACRGGPMADKADKADSAFDFYFANPTNKLLTEQANFNKGLNRSCKVGSYEPNRLGLFDMHGNVWEWCNDAVVRQGTLQRALRGGCWDDEVAPTQAKTWFAAPRGFRKNNGGLRLARVPSGAPSPEAKTPLATDRFALAFDGEKSVVRIPSLKITEDHALTAEAWAMLEQTAVSNDKNEDLLGNASSSGFCLSVPYRNGGKTAFSIRLKNPDNYFVAWEKQGGPRHQLIHFAGVYDGKTEIRYYVNGQLQSRRPAERVKTSNKPLVLGNNQTGTAGFLGRMNGVRLSKVARYDNDFTPDNRWVPDTDTLALYHFDEGQGAVLKDSSGNGHHGEIVGAKWVQADGSPIGSSHAVPSEPLPATYKNSLSMEFVIVLKGKSWLGGGKDKLGDREVEIPADFYLGKYEVTQEEWEKVMGENPSHFSRIGKGMDAVKDISDADLKRFPLENVSWDKCQLFVAKLNEQMKETGWVYRLPTAAEWEYACRGGPTADRADSAFDFYFAKPTNTLLSEQANIYGKGLKRTCKVGSYEANVLGLYDVYGNVREWCADTHQAPDASHRVNRGGGWDFGSVDCRTADRRSDPPSWVAANLGLRLARVPSGTPSPEAKTPPVALAPFTDADVKRIAALPATEQVEEVRKELMKRNPGFDGKVEHKIEDGVVTEIKVVTDTVTDIAPIRVFNALRLLECGGTYTDKPNGLLADLTPLKGMNLGSLIHLYLVNTSVADAGLIPFNDCKALTHVGLAGTRVTDAGLTRFKDCKNLAYLNLGHTQVGDAGLDHFKDCKGLNRLHLSRTKVSDAGLAQFKDCKNLTHLILDNTQVGDAGLAHFKGMPLKDLAINNTGITDLTPLQSMPLEEIRLTPKNITQGLDILRAMKSLKTIGIAYKQSWPAAEFWERYDKGEFKE